MSLDFLQAGASREAAIDAFRHNRKRVEADSDGHRPLVLLIVRAQKRHDHSAGHA
jgi:hypothetical protein